MTQVFVAVATAVIHHPSIFVHCAVFLGSSPGGQNRHLLVILKATLIASEYILLANCVRLKHSALVTTAAQPQSSVKINQVENCSRVNSLFDFQPAHSSTNVNMTPLTTSPNYYYSKTSSDFSCFTHVRYVIISFSTTR